MSFAQHEIQHALTSTHKQYQKAWWLNLLLKPPWRDLSFLLKKAETYCVAYITKESKKEKTVYEKVITKLYITKPVKKVSRQFVEESKNIIHFLFGCSSSGEIRQLQISFVGNAGIGVTLLSIFNTWKKKRAFKVIHYYCNFI